MDKCTRDLQLEFNRRQSRCLSILQAEARDVAARRRAVEDRKHGIDLFNYYYKTKMDKKALVAKDVVNYYEKLLLGDGSKIPGPHYDPRDVAFKPVNKETKMNDMEEEMQDLLGVYTKAEQHLKERERTALDNLNFYMKKYLESQEERKVMMTKLEKFKEKIQAMELNGYDDEEAETEDDDD